MEQEEFLGEHVFTNRKDLNNGFDEESNKHFSQDDFESILDQVQYFGIGVYKIEGWLNGLVFESASHETFKKKATDPKWYLKAFKTMYHRQEDMSYTATYKVSKKLLARESG